MIKYSGLHEKRHIANNKTDAGAEAKLSVKRWGITAEISGKVSSSRENTRSTNQTA